jgi:hypothetical protein
MFNDQYHQWLPCPAVEIRERPQDFLPQPTQENYCGPQFRLYRSS